ncbi:KLTH0C00550p [Lachancea thermotolerans CBS 6340]|uniref:KLTH0C00550p n=1 Tax=Lachancea thermotolerans (strain ATCC 56472 / CBS 6340 / NRRL Y-8284) TaxID=559295 RepID=C5DDF3_LACTC|nr:KLTH0C00550p [Lachancea thermotolerans CBS 6340]CAR21814.1 KLTH0C00550p [Lachancea thermotolerans CBS 6340]
MDDGCLIDFLLEDDFATMNADSSCLDSKWLVEKDCICDDRVIKRPNRKTKSRTKSKRRSLCKELLDESIDELVNLIIKDTKLSLTIGSEPNQRTKVPQTVSSSKKKSRREGWTNKIGDDQGLLTVFGGEQLAGEFAFNLLDVPEPDVTTESNKKKKVKRNRTRNGASKKAESHPIEPTDQSYAATKGHGHSSAPNSNAEKDAAVKKGKNKKKKRKGQADDENKLKGNAKDSTKSNSQPRAESRDRESQRKDKSPINSSSKSGPPVHGKRSSRKKTKSASSSNNDQSC